MVERNSHFSVPAPWLVGQVPATSPFVETLQGTSCRDWSQGPVPSYVPTFTPASRLYLYVFPKKNTRGCWYNPWRVWSVQEAHSFPRASLTDICLLLRTDNPAGIQRSEMLKLRTFALIVSAHPYCARKFTRQVMHQERALCNKMNNDGGRWPLLQLCLDLKILDVRWPPLFFPETDFIYNYLHIVQNCKKKSAVWKGNYNLVKQL